MLFRTAHHSGPLEVELDPAQHPLREVRRAEVPRRGARQGYARLPAASRRTPPTASPGSACSSSCPASARRRPRRSSTRWRRRRAGAGAAAARGAGARRGRLGGLRRALRRAARRRRRLAGRAGVVRAWYEPHLERRHEDAPVRRADLVQLEAIAAGYPSRERFLTEITLDPPGASGDQAGLPHRDEDYLILSTIHSAKGQEWQRVFVLNCRRRLHSLRPRHRHQRRDRRGAAAVLRRDDPRPRRASPVLPQRFYVHGQHRKGDRHVYATAQPVHRPTASSTASRSILAAGRGGRAGSCHRRPAARALDLGARMRAMWS